MTSWATPPLFSHKLATLLQKRQFISQISNIFKIAFVAQLVEHQTPNSRVVSSSFTEANFYSFILCNAIDLIIQVNMEHYIIFLNIFATMLTILNCTEH